MKIELVGRNDKKLILETHPSIGGESITLDIKDASTSNGISIDKEQFYAVVELLKLEKIEKR